MTGREPLDVWIYGTRIARLFDDSYEPGQIGFLEPIDNEQVAELLAEAAGSGPVIAPIGSDHFQSISLAWLGPEEFRISEG